MDVFRVVVIVAYIVRSETMAKGSGSSGIAYRRTTMYIVVPVILAQVVRRQALARGGPAALRRLLDRLQPVSLAALLTTLVMLFGFQGDQIIAQPLVIALLAVPILIQVYFNSALAYLLNRATGEAHCVAPHRR
jgi:ACR3 family arsenite transporter